MMFGQRDRNRDQPPDRPGPNPHLPMRLRIETRHVGPVSILDLSGQLVMGNETLALSQHCEQLVQRQRTQLVINIQQVTFIDSSGVGELVAVLSCAKRAGGSLKILRPTEMVRRVLEISHVNRVLDIFDSEEEAIASFEDG